MQHPGRSVLRMYHLSPSAAKHHVSPTLVRRHRYILHVVSRTNQVVCKGSSLRPDNPPWENGDTIMTQGASNQDNRGRAGTEYFAHIAHCTPAAAAEPRSPRKCYKRPLFLHRRGSTVIVLAPSTLWLVCRGSTPAMVLVFLRVTMSQARQKASGNWS